jgi:hypothetical protein
MRIISICRVIMLWVCTCENHSIKLIPGSFLPSDRIFNLIAAIML